MDKVIVALTGLFQAVVQVYGPGPTLLIALGVVAIFAGNRYWQDRRKQKSTDLALEEKERTIQRLSRQEREWRAYFMMEKGLSPEEVERFVFQNKDFDTPEQARKHLEKPKDPTPAKSEP